MQHERRIVCHEVCLTCAMESFGCTWTLRIPSSAVTRPQLHATKKTDKKLFTLLDGIRERQSPSCSALRSAASTPTIAGSSHRHP